MYTYTDKEIILVWQKATIVPGYDAAVIRKDRCGAWIRLADFGNRNSLYGWEVDHIVPTSRNGDHTIDNVQPLHWRNNAAKSNGPLVCAITAKR
jgi:5-methylcytosine-specific restriction endonuclease McrA